jgi:mono/diheme cytochrome c family protein
MRVWIGGALVLGAVAVLTATPALARPLLHSRKTVATDGDPVAGKHVFQTAGCANCHTLKAAGATGTGGPNLDELKPTYNLIVLKVTNGGDYMPAFGGTLTVQQIQDVAAFVYASTHVAVTKVAVQAGKTVPVGAAAFTVVNRGKTTHTFKVCSSPKGGKANACAGKATAPIRPGKTATLTVVFKTKGSYEYLCTIPGHAAAGMKGLLRVT